MKRTNMNPSSRYDETRDCVLLQARNSEFGDAVFLARHGRRHYVPSAKIVAELGLRWPEDVLQVPAAVIRALSIGGPVPHRFAPDADPRQIVSSMEMREYMARNLRGLGLEVGAGASPFPVPLHCRVLYGDKWPHERLVRELYPGQAAHNLVVPDLQTEFETFRGIADESLDFIIGCHVIEHTRNPIGAIATAHRKLKPGGQLLLVVPEKTRTFDRERPLTPLSHLIDDYRHPDRTRDLQHYDEFFTLAFPTPEERRAQAIREADEFDADIHFHVWNYPSFMEMIEYVNREVVKWLSVWSHPPLSNPELDIEFYVALTK